MKSVMSCKSWNRVNAVRACESQAGEGGTIFTSIHKPASEASILFPYGRKSKERIISEKYTLSWPAAGFVVAPRVGVGGREGGRERGWEGEERRQCARSESIFRKSTVKRSLTASIRGVDNRVRAPIDRPIDTRLISIEASCVENRNVNNFCSATSLSFARV